MIGMILKAFVFTLRLSSFYKKMFALFHSDAKNYEYGLFIGLHLKFSLSQRLTSSLQRACIQHIPTIALHI